MSIEKKNVLDLLYTAKAELTKKANSENVESYQLPETDVSGRNLAAGRSTAYEKSSKIVDEVIKDVLTITEQ